MPIPTTSPLWMSSKLTGSSVSSTRWGSPHVVPVAAARTYNQRGVMTATPNDRLLGLIRWTRGNAISYSYRGAAEGGFDGTPFTTDDQQAPAGAGADCQAERQGRPHGGPQAGRSPRRARRRGPRY